MLPVASCTRGSGPALPNRRLRVTIDFHDRGGKTEVVLRHDRFSDLKKRNEHEQGWGLCFDQLAEYIRKEEKKR